jgi:hypothetical protein
MPTYKFQIGQTVFLTPSLASIAAPGPLERRHHRKSLPLAVNEDACDRRRKGEHDQKAAEYHSQPYTR